MSRKMQRGYKILLGLSLILLDIIGNSDSMPVPAQPAVCREGRPKSSPDSLCSGKDTRYFHHLSNLKGCKKFGICSEDSAIHDNLTNENYFLTYEECQKECMQHVPCPDLTVVGDNVILVSDNNLIGWGKKVEYECSNGYSLSDNSKRAERLCQKNGTWSGREPVCLEQCEPPVEIEHGDIAPSKDYHNQGGTVHYTCDVGYQLEDSATRTCESNGTWSGQEPRCVCQVASDNDECVSCPEPLPLDHGDVLAPNRSQGSFLKYKCDPGYILIGNSTRECIEKGEWSGEEPICWKLSIEKQETEHEAKEDITNKSVSIPIQSNPIIISVISSDPNPFQDEELEWTFNGSKQLPHAVTVDKTNLVFSSIFASGEQNGTYSITVGNYSVCFKLKTAAVDRTEEPPNILLHPKLIGSVGSGETVGLNCVLQGCPAPAITWYHDGIQVFVDNRRTINMVNSHVLAIGELTINAVTEDDAGNYWCKGANGVGSNVTSDRATLLVESRTKRSAADVKSILCDSELPDTVVLIGRVKRYTRSNSGSSVPAGYRIKMKRLIRGAVGQDDNITTIVVDGDAMIDERLIKNTDYIFRGRYVNKIFLVSKQNIYRHNRELEKHIINVC